MPGTTEVPEPNGDGGASARPAGAFARAAEDGMSGAAMLRAAGGTRGILEAMLPGLVFLVLFTVTRELWLSAVAPAVLGVLFVLARAVQRQNLGPALGGLIAIAISGLLALRTGDGADYYVPGFFTNGAYALGFLISVIVGWPAVGLVAGLAFGRHPAWRGQRRLRRLMSALTLCWAAFFLLRLAVQLPLYFAGSIEALGVTRLIMGTPMYAVLLVATAVLARGAFRACPLPADEDEAVQPEADGS